MMGDRISTPIEARPPCYSDTDWEQRYREECKIVDRVWRALGIETYEQANGETIWEIVARLKTEAGAAPDLLAALRAYLSAQPQCDCTARECPMEAARIKARAAIAKALGDHP